MNPKYRYRVKTVCTATVEEEWTVESDRPLTDQQLDDILVGAELDGEDVPDTITYSCIEEEVSNERDRSYVESYAVDDEEDEQSERTDCGGCGESWNVSESDAKDPESYCSAYCETEDTGSDEEWEAARG